MLLRVLILLAILLVVPTVYIYFGYVRHWTKKVRLRLLTFVPAVALLIYLLVVLHFDDMHVEHQVMVGRFMVIFLAFTVPPMLFTLIDCWGWIRRNTSFQRIVRIVAMTVALFSLIVLGYGYYVGRSRYVVNEQTLCFPNLPKQFDGYRIAHFSDLHLGTFYDGHQEDVTTIVNLINSLDCDAILFTGDLVNYESRESNGYRRVLSQLKAKDGVFAVMGNHYYSMYIKTLSPEMVKADIEELQRRERSYGWQLLLNENVVLKRGNDSIAIIGTENDGRPPFPSLGDLPKATQGLCRVMLHETTTDSLHANDATTDSLHRTWKGHTFSILMTHDPTHWRRNVLPETNIDLTLSGHTHAGQFKVFGWSPMQYIYTEWSGIYQQGSQVINVNDGVGQVMFPYRFGAWPEIDVITLKTLNCKP